MKEVKKKETDMRKDINRRRERARDVAFEITDI